MRQGWGEVEILRSHLKSSAGLSEEHLNTVVEAFRDSGEGSFVDFLAKHGVVEAEAAPKLKSAVRGEGPIHGLIKPASAGLQARLLELRAKKSGATTLPPFLGVPGDRPSSLEERLSNIVRAAVPRAASQESPASFLRPGARFGRYDLEKKLGSGSSSVTFLSRHPTLGIPIALKIHRPTARIQSGADASGFEREARILARLDHPNIVRVLDVDVEQGLTYIVFEFGGETSFEQEIGHAGRVSSVRAAEIGLALADALDTAWSAKVLHRDVKPENVLVRADGRVKLVDFGLATADEAKDRDLVVGSPAYMAPEQITEPDRVDHRADMYALGATLYHALVGRPVFMRETPKETLRAQLYDRPVPPRQVASDVHPEVERVVLRMLEKRREDRYSAWPEAVEALADALGVAAQGASESRGAVNRLLSALLR